MGGGTLGCFAGNREYPETRLVPARTVARDHRQPRGVAPNRHHCLYSADRPSAPVGKSGPLFLHTDAGSYVARRKRARIKRNPPSLYLTRSRSLGGGLDGVAEGHGGEKDKEERGDAPSEAGFRE